MLVLGGIWGLAGKGWAVGFHLVLFGLWVVRLLESGPNCRSRCAESRGITVATYNVKFKHLRSPALLARWVQQQQPFVVALQESDALFLSTDSSEGVLLRGTVKNVLSAYDACLPLDGPGTAPTYFYGSTLAYRVTLPVLQLSDRQDVETREELGSMEGKVFGCENIGDFGVRSRIQWQDRWIAVYNVHFQSFSAKGLPQGESLSERLMDWVRQIRSDFIVRARQAEVLRSMMDREEIPFIVCGDFNSTPDNWVYWHVARRLIRAPRIRTLGWRGTYPASLPVVPIDHVLASRHWWIAASSVGPGVISDHRPLAVRLVFHDQGAEQEN